MSRRVTVCNLNTPKQQQKYGKEKKGKFFEPPMVQNTQKHKQKISAKETHNFFIIIEARPMFSIDCNVRGGREGGDFFFTTIINYHC